MTLLSPLALLFGLAAIVPLILHLYQRRRRSVIEFSTNRFFTAEIIRSQRRLRLRRLLLLLLRVGACVLLGLALARPIISLAGVGRAGNRDVVILLDDSLSMQAAEGGDRGIEGSREQGTIAGGDTQFDHARRLAIGVLNELSSGDRAAVITLTGRTLGHRTRVDPSAPGAPATGLELTGDLLGLAGELEKLPPTAAAGDARTALSRAAALLSQSGPRHPWLLVLTDLQETDWRQADWPQPPHTVGVALVRLRPPTQDNVVADQMVLSQGTTVVGQPNLLRVRLVNYRPATTPVVMVLTVDGREQVRRPLELPGGSPHVERIPLVFDEAGEHRLKLSVEVNDALPADNTLFAAVTVNPLLSVLLVDGQAAAGPRQSAAFYTRAALRVTSRTGQSVQADVVPPTDLPGVTLDSYRVVVLSAVRDLPLAQVERLEQFVQAGGGLAIFLGADADRDFYNELMGGPSRPLGGLLPAEVRGLRETAGGERPLYLAEADLSHPMLQRFKDNLRGALAGINVYRAHAVVPRDAWVVATLDQQLPLIVERTYGRGKVILFTTAPEPRSTNLPLRRSFLPLMTQMVSYLAGGGAGDADHNVGEQLMLLRGGWDASQPLYVVRPDGGRVLAAVQVVGAEPQAALPADAVDQPGFYQLESPSSAGPQRPASGHTVLAVNTPRRESVPHVIAPAELEKPAGKWRLRVVDATGLTGDAVRGEQGVLTTLMTSGPAGRGIWDALLWTVLILVLVEPLIANRIRGARAADAATSARRAA
jgi:hypothetical protein